MRAKFFDYHDNELSLAQEFYLASTYIEYPKRDDYVNFLRKDTEEKEALHEYNVAKNIYKYLHLKLKDKEISTIALVLNLSNE